MLIGYAEAIGHHGELLQGLFEGANGRFHRALVSLPCPRMKAKATFRPDDSDGVTVAPSFREKARRAAELTLQVFDRHRTGGTLSIDSNIAIGRGMGSSTADVLASILAVMNWLGIEADAGKVMQIAIDAETACDSTLFSQQAVLFAHREGLVVEAFRRMLPPVDIVSVDTAPDTTVDTLQFDPARYDQREIETFRPIRSLLRRAIDNGDAALLGRVATASARINERFLPKPRFGELEAIGNRFGAVGIQVAHSGTIVGLMFDSQDTATPGNMDRTAEALQRFGFSATIFQS